ncbi:MAG: hypothetical protein GX425_07900 [Peptococcaceae bacterium]|nr:hypothetical protein [Peptococcaceae bacterium]
MDGALLVTALFISAAGLFTLFIIFLKTGGKGGKKQFGVSSKDKDVAKVRDMIEKIEKENPDLVAKIRSQLAAEKKVEVISKAEDEDIGGAVKHWLSENEKE